MEVERPSTPVPVELPETMEASVSASTPAPSSTEVKPTEPEVPQITNKGKRNISTDESHLQEYVDGTERVNVNKDFGEAAKRVKLDGQTFQNDHQLGHDTMEEVIPWIAPPPLNLSGLLVQMGRNSTEKHKKTQAELETGVLQEGFLSKESVPDTPHEPDPEPYEPAPPKLIPLDEGAQVNAKPEDLMKQPDFSDPPQHDGYWEPPPNEMKGENHEPMGGRGGGMRWYRGHPSPFYRNRGGEPGFRRQGGRGGERGPPGRGIDGPHGMGHSDHRGYSGEHRGHGGEHRGRGKDMSRRPRCRHFMYRGYCRYENDCGFYHPGVNGPPLP